MNDTGIPGCYKKTALCVEVILCTWAQDYVEDAHNETYYGVELAPELMFIRQDGIFEPIILEG